MNTTDRLCSELQQRRRMGLSKYGVSIDDNQLSRVQWLQHAKEEALDMAEYLQRLIDEENKPDWPESEEKIEAIGQNGGDGIHHKILNAGLYDT